MAQPFTPLLPAIKRRTFFVCGLPQESSFFYERTNKNCSISFQFTILVGQSFRQQRKNLLKRALNHIIPPHLLKLVQLYESSVQRINIMALRALKTVHLTTMGEQGKEAKNQLVFCVFFFCVFMKKIVLVSKILVGYKSLAERVVYFALAASKSMS